MYVCLRVPVPHPGGLTFPGYIARPRVSRRRFGPARSGLFAEQPPKRQPLPPLLVPKNGLLTMSVLYEGAPSHPAHYRRFMRTASPDVTGLECLPFLHVPRNKHQIACALCNVLVALYYCIEAGLPFWYNSPLLPSPFCF